MGRTAVYVRVSSRGQSTRSQEPDLKRWVSAEQAAGAELDWFRDAFTGRTFDRPGWSALWRGALTGEYRRVVVWRLDRLGRTARELAALFDEMTRRGLTLVSLRDGIDLDTPAGRLMAHVLASVAQYETEVRSERQAAGIEAARSRGVRFGRPAGTGRPLTLTPERRALIARLRIEEGRGVSEVARLVGVSRQSVYDVTREASPSGGGGDAAGGL